MAAPATAGKAIARTVLLLAVSAGAVALVTVTAWDHDGFFPWFWNPLWLIFPWVFLAPLWFAHVRAIRRAPRADGFRALYAREQATARPRLGAIDDVRVSRTENGGIAGIVAAVSDPLGAVVVGRAAPGTDGVAAHEAPEPGDQAHVWRLSDGTALVQVPRALRDRRRADATAGSRSAADAASTDPASADLVEQLARLGELHDRGDLDDHEFRAAKRRLLGEG
ncbi:SHOCT domain-containing protein [Schumannella sp. 10F1B-5-1]|nr:SHOCT domain-containing protein [Schumannella sp. 10F1B-5-1]